MARLKALIAFVSMATGSCASEPPKAIPVPPGRLSINLTSPRKNDQKPDTVYFASPYVRRVFLTSKYLENYALLNNYEYNMEAYCVLHEHHMLKPKMHFVHDTLYVDFSNVLQKLHERNVAKFEWTSYFRIDYLPNNQQVDTTFAVREIVYIKGGKIRVFDQE